MSEKKVDLDALARDLKGMEKPRTGRLRWILKWFVVLVLLVVVGGGAFAYWQYQKVLGNEAFKQAMKKIRESAEIKTALGEPVELVYVRPAPSIRQEAGEIDILWTVAGPSGVQAKAHVFQRLMVGKWETVIADATLPDGKKVSLLDENDENAPPPFVPSAANEAKPDMPVNPSGNPPPGKQEEENLPDDLAPKMPPVEDAK